MALASAFAGLTAFLTDRVFVRRDLRKKTLERLFVAKYRVTSWGETLLAAILVAPAVQFVGDWINNATGARSQQDTAQQIRKTSTERSSRAPK